MSTPQKPFKPSPAGLVVVLIFLLLSWLPTLVQAEVTDLPPRPTPATSTPTPLPGATPTPTATSSGVESQKKKPGRPVGAYIRLQVSQAAARGWTMVQWQDAQGDWHDVPGWQGSLEAGTKIWWVAPADFGKGPFRWVMYDQSGGRQIGATELFQLPAESRETVVVPLSLP